MAISNKLVDKFIKATKDNSTKTKKEKIVYGKVTRVEIGEAPIYHVQIDGAEENNTIPVSCFTTSVKEGNKVIVTIKDHTAIITGNMSNPSADNEDVGDIINTKISEVSSIDIKDIEALWN